MSLERVDRIRKQEKFNEVDGIILTKPQNIIYILGFGIESETVIFIPNLELKNHDGRIWVFLNALEYDQAKDLINEDKDLVKIIDIKLIPQGEPGFVSSKINNLQLKSIGFEEDFISVKKFNEWSEKFDAQKIGTSEIMNNARLIKTNSEIERMKKAAELGEIGFQAIFDEIEEGMTEKELAALAEYEMRKAGSEGTSFDTIVASGENSAYPHAKASQKKIEDGDLIIVDIGARYKNYCSDMTRTFIYGKIDENKKKLINLVNEGQQFALDNIKAGIECAEIDKLVRDFFIEKHNEWGNRFIHSLGHGVGIDIHENPYLSPISLEVLEENVVVTVEPGLYIPGGLGGARTEDQILIKQDGFVSFTNSKKIYY